VIAMQAIDTSTLELADISSPGDETREVRAAFPIHWQTGATSTAMVYFELEPGMHLGTHTDSAEELLVVLEGQVEATVSEESARLAAGGVAVVPAMEPHDVSNVGSATARVAGIFGANATAAVFEKEFSVMGTEPTRVNGTPPPEVAPQAAAV
jgi:quercetin dioxygenase-like cupin family protein